MRDCIQDIIVSFMMEVRLAGKIFVSIEEARLARNHIDKVERKVGNRSVVEQFVAGALNPSILNKAKSATEAASYAATRLDALADPLEKGEWSIQQGRRPIVSANIARYSSKVCDRR